MLLNMHRDWKKREGQSEEKDRESYIRQGSKILFIWGVFNSLSLVGSRVDACFLTTFTPYFQRSNLSQRAFVSFLFCPVANNGGLNKGWINTGWFTTNEPTKYLSIQPTNRQTGLINKKDINKRQRRNNRITPQTSDGSWLLDPSPFLSPFPSAVLPASPCPVILSHRIK